MRLWSVIGGAWLYNDYTYTAASQAGMVSPSAGSVLPGASATFNWSTGNGVSQAYIWIGTSPGGNNLAQSGGAGATSFAASSLPTNGSTIYVRLWSVIGGSWLYTDYTYTAATVSQATMTSPAAGSTLPGASATFNWSAGGGVSQAYIGLEALGRQQ